MKQTLTILFVLGMMTIQAQSDKKFLIRADIGYHYKHDDGLDQVSSINSYYYYGEITRDVNLNLNGGIKLKSNFYLGLGLNYHNGKKETNPDEDVPDVNISSSTGYATFLSYTNSTTIENTTSPYLFFQYFNNLTDWLTISADLYSMYDYTHIHSTSVSHMQTIVFNDTLVSVHPGEPFGDITSDGYDYSRGKDVKKQTLHIGLRPSLRFNVLKNAGLTFTFGQIQYSTKTKDSRASDEENKTKSFNIDFSPSNWLFGFYVRL